MELKSLHTLDSFLGLGSMFRVLLLHSCRGREVPAVALKLTTCIILCLFPLLSKVVVILSDHA